MKDSKTEVSLLDLPRDLINLIMKYLNPQEIARFSQVSQQFFKQGWSGIAKQAALSKEMEHLIVKVLDNLNPHDLYFLARKNENIALIVVQTPELAKKLNQDLYGDYHQAIQKGYKKEQYDPENCLDKTGGNYRYDINTPLAIIAKEHPTVARLLLSDDYNVIALNARTKNGLQEIEPPSSSPSNM